jgi:hypothetical protein
VKMVALSRQTTHVLDAGASAAATNHLSAAGAPLACLKLLQECSSNSGSSACLEAGKYAAQLLAWLLRSSSSGATGSSSSSSSAPSKGSAPAKPATAGAAKDGSRDASRSTASSGGAVSAASSNELLPGAVPVLLAALKVREQGVRLPAAAAVGQLLRRPSAAADR